MSSTHENELCLKLEKISKIYQKEEVNCQNSSRRLSKLFEYLFKSHSTTKFSKKSFFALKEVSFELSKSQCLGIIGLNGSGKSTLMQLIAGTLRQSSGSLEVNGKVAALLELGSGFNPDFTGRENVIINAKIHGLTERKIRSKFDEIIKFADIGDFFDQPVSTYSSGMTLRLAFAVIVQLNPEILIIDEALAVGDARFQLKCFKFLEEFKDQGGTLILVSHDLNSIARFCSEVILLDKGKLVCVGKPNKVINEYSKIISNNENPDLENGQKSLISKNNSNQPLSEGKLSEVESSIFSNSLMLERFQEEFTYGGKKAKIDNIKLINSEGSETEILNSGEKFTVKFIVQAHSIIRDPIFAMTIKDLKGQQVYGQNTHFAKKSVPSLEIDDMCKVEFNQNLNLGSGEYFISLGCTCFAKGELEVIHRRYDTLKFEVLNSDGSFGMANCFSQIACYLQKSSAKKNQVECLHFNFEGESLILQRGNSFSTKAIKPCFRDAPLSEMESIIEEIKAGKSWKKVIQNKYQEKNPWLCDIITNQKRTFFVDDFLKPENVNVLDIGAGWGQFCVPLAKKNLVCALEPTPERLDFVQTRAEQEKVLESMFFLGVDYMDVHFETKFDLILSIGVLEWVGAFRESNQPPEEIQKEFLSKIRTDLVDGGKLIIGIENRLGLKYLMGANDDHTGIPNISCFSKDLAREKFKQQTNKELKCITYNLKEYQNLLLKSGFQKIIFYAALPDYKLPEKIFPLSEDQTKCDLNKFILEDRRVDEHDGTNGKKLGNQEEIWSIYNSLAEIGIAHYFAPSFYIEAF